MDKQKKILIYGAGAIGCTIAVNLIHAGFSQVTLVARGENFKVLQQDGIYLSDLSGEYHVRPFQVVESIEALPAQDYLFICTKADAIKSITLAIKGLVHANSVVIPLVNGIPFWYFYLNDDASDIKTIQSLDPDGFIKQHFPFAQLIGAVVFITAELIEYGRVKSNNPYLLILGEPNHTMSPRLTQLTDLFKQTPIEARPHAQIRDQIWTKVLANLSSNPLSVLTGATLRQIYSDPHLKPTTDGILQEIRLVAASYAARIQFDPQQFSQLGADMGDIHTSMWHDFKQKKPLELSSIGDAVLELAQAYNIEMPLTEKIIAMTRFISEQQLKTV